MPKQNMICDICGKEFTSKLANLRRHLREQHNIIENIESNIKCMEPNCNFGCTMIKDLRKHLEMEHKITQEMFELNFADMEDFHKWKEAEETWCVAVWVKGTVTAKPNDAKIYYYCSRSGKKRLIANDQRKRKMKSQGSRKIGFFCTSSIVASIVPWGVSVKYFKTHYGHDNKTDHVPLPRDIKDMIASQLIQGIPHTEILASVKESSDIDIKRVHQISGKDIHNIIREYNLRNTYAEPERSTFQIDKVDKWHKIAANSPKMLVLKFDDGWSILSDDKSYTVKKNKIEENHLCKLKCPECLICQHSYSCSCMDFVLYNNICKHIHKLCMSDPSESKKEEIGKEVLQREVVNSQDQTTDQTESHEVLNAQDQQPARNELETEIPNDEEQIVNGEELQNETEQEQKIDEVLQQQSNLLEERKTEMIKAQIRKNLNTILIMSDWANITDLDTLNKINEYLDSVLNLIDSNENASDIQKEVVLEVVPTAAKAEEKLRHFPTKLIQIASPQLTLPSIQADKMILQNEPIEDTSKILHKYRPVVPVGFSQLRFLPTKLIAVPAPQEPRLTLEELRNISLEFKNISENL